MFSGYFILAINTAPSNTGMEENLLVDPETFFFWQYSFSA
jgi:hypothetical protein